MNGVRILAVCAFVAIVAGFAAVIMSEKEIAAAEIGIAAQEVIDECASAREKSLCYERVVPRYMDDGFTMEQAFEITKEVQRLDPRSRIAMCWRTIFPQKKQPKILRNGRMLLREPHMGFVETADPTEHSRSVFAMSRCRMHPSMRFSA